MDYITIKNWEKFQTYKDREPKWIKIYRTLLNDYKYEPLTDSEFGQLVKLWLLASQMDNKIPNDPTWIQKKCSMSGKPNIDRYIALDFIHLYSSVQNCTDLYEQVESSVHREETDKRREEKNIYGSFQNVKLTEDEYQKLVAKFKDQTTNKIESMSLYLESKGDKYKSHYATILNWARKENEQTKDIKEDHWVCRNCGKKATSIIGGLCPKCHDLASQQSNLGLKDI